MRGLVSLLIILQLLHQVLPPELLSQKLGIIADIQKVYHGKALIYLREDIGLQVGQVFEITYERPSPKNKLVIVRDTVRVIEVTTRTAKLEFMTGTDLLDNIYHLKFTNYLFTEKPADTLIVADTLQVHVPPEKTAARDTVVEQQIVQPPEREDTLTDFRRKIITEPVAAREKLIESEEAPDKPTESPEIRDDKIDDVPFYKKPVFWISVGCAVVGVALYFIIRDGKNDNEVPIEGIIKINLPAD